MSKNAKTLTQTQHGITIDCRYQQFLAIYISNPFSLPRFSIIGSIWCTGCFRYSDLSRASLEIFLCKMAFLKSPSRLYTLYYHHVPFAMLTPAEQLILPYGLYCYMPSNIMFMTSRCYYYLFGDSVKA